MSPNRHSPLIALLLWGFLAPLFFSSCISSGLSDKRILQYLNQEGFGKRYTGHAEEQDYVTIGDSIQFKDKLEDLSGADMVKIDGTIHLPEVGRVFVAGMTAAELESFLNQKFSAILTKPDIEVEIRTGGSKVFWVIGEVRNEGPVPFRGDITIFEAVTRAGPNKSTANLGRIRLIRADPRNPLIIPVNLPDLWLEGDSTYNIRLQEYDLIYVPPTFLTQVADLISSILVPLVRPFRTVLQTIFQIQNPGSIGRGQRRF